jgi:PIN domain nuclease of toxin-antitoxin system
LPSRDLHLKLEREIGIRVCDLDFPSIVNIALNEKWTRDPFDRIIVSQAKVKGLAHLVSADEEIRQWYPRAVW